MNEHQEIKPIDNLTYQKVQAPRTADHSIKWPFIILLTLLGIWIVLVELPAPPGAQGTGLGASWIYGLNMAHQRGFSFGTDVVFTYGPLSYLIHPDPEGLSARVYFFYLLCSYALLLFSLATCFRAASSKVLGAFVCCALVSADIFAPHDTGTATITLIAASAAILARDDLALIPFAVSLISTAFLLLTRFNEGAMAYAGLCCLVAWNLRKSGRWPPDRRPASVLLALAILPAATLVVILWTQPDGWHAVWGYIRGSVEIARGYNQVMGIAPPRWQWRLGLWSTVALFTLTPLFAAKRRSLLPGLILAAFLGYMSYKSAMTRGDHATAYQVTLAGLAVLPLMSARSRRDRLLLGSYCVLNLVLGISIARKQDPGLIDWGSEQARLHHWVRSVQAIMHAGSYWDQMRNDTEAGLKSLVIDPLVAHTIGSAKVDVVPVGIDYVRANHWNWRPRPVMQSYSAYTPYLDNLNATLFTRPEAAKHILLHWFFIDGRSPFIDDVASWRSLINWYDCELKRPEYLILRHRDAPRYSSSVPLGRQDVAYWNKPLIAPSIGTNEILLMRADIKQSFGGTLKSLYLGSAPVLLEFTHSSGRVTTVRTAWPNLTAGAVVSSVPENLNELGQFFGAPLPGLKEKVVSFRFLSPHLHEFERAIPIKWEKISAIDTKSEKAFNSELSTTRSKMHFRPVWRPDETVLDVSGANVVTRESELRVHALGIDPHFLFPVSGELNTMKTLMIRARFSKASRIDLGFGTGSAKFGISGYVPVSNEWLDIYVNVSANPDWARHVGKLIRFDPSSEGGTDSMTEILGLWGSEDAIDDYVPQGMYFFRSAVR